MSHHRPRVGRDLCSTCLVVGTHRELWQRRVDAAGEHEDSSRSDLSRAVESDMDMRSSALVSKQHASLRFECRNLRGVCSQGM
jgi:hypothetical protein